MISQIFQKEYKQSQAITHEKVNNLETIPNQEKINKSNKIKIIY